MQNGCPNGLHVASGINEETNLNTDTGEATASAEAPVALTHGHADDLSQALDELERKTSPFTEFSDTLSTELFGPQPAAEDASSS